MNELREIKTDLETNLQERQRVLDILCDFIRISIADNMHVAKSSKGNLRQAFDCNVINNIALIISAADDTITLGNSGITISISKTMLGDIKVAASRTQYGAIRMCSYTFPFNEWCNISQALYTLAIDKIKDIVCSTGVEVCRNDLEPIINASIDGLYIGVYRGETDTTEFLKEK